MAMRRTSSADLITPKVDRGAWLKATSKRPQGMTKTASEVLSLYDPNKWLLSHVTIMASVDIELADSKDLKSDYYIKPDHSVFVNNNGDCWERELLYKTFRTFVGANNYVEHIQQPEFSRGKVIDAAIREVDLGVGQDGEPNTTYYVDLLIATSWEFPDMCEKILRKEYNAVSMGCLIQYSRCSRCGNVAADEAEQCEHIQYYRKNYFYDEFGKKRIIAEICGHKDDPSSVQFIDASWVRKPAFTGAVLHNIVSPPETIKMNLEKSQKEQKGVDPLMASLQKRIDLKTEHHDVGAFLKAASVKNADEETDEGAARFEEPPATEEGTDAFPEMPQEDGPAVPEEGDAGGVFPDEGESGGEEGEEPGVSPEEADATPFADIRKSIEDSVITNVKQVLLDKLQKTLQEKSKQDEVAQGIIEHQDVFREADSIVKEASTRKTAKYVKDRYSIDISQILDIKTAANIMAFAVAKNPSVLKKLGFTRDDMMGVLDFIEARRHGTPVARDVYSYIKTAGFSNVKDPVLGFMTKAVRPLTAREKSVFSTWSKILKQF
jgi:hypothetical protein